MISGSISTLQRRVVSQLASQELSVASVETNAHKGAGFTPKQYGKPRTSARGAGIKLGGGSLGVGGSAAAAYKPRIPVL